MILLLQFRRDVSGPHDVECYYRQAGVPFNEFFILNVLNKAVTKTLIEDLISKSRGVIIGGLGETGFEYLYDEDAPAEKKDLMYEILDFMKPITLELLRQDFPTLGACFGIQLIMYYLGAELTSDMKYRETGIYKIYVTETGKKDRVFNRLAPEFYAVLGHKTSVVGLPKYSEFNIELLAYSDRAPVQAVRIGNNVYLTQFHPEMDKQAMVERTKMYPSYLKANPDVLRDIPSVEAKGVKILREWVRNVVRGALL